MKNLEELDPKLEALRRQIGEAAWEARKARAREREAVVQEVRRRMAEGCSKAAAVRSVGAEVSEQTICHWMAQYSAGGLSGLIERSGQLTSLGQKDPAVSDRNVKRRRTRFALSFVKWVGGKQTILPQLLARVPRTFKTYFEPMVGSGALFLSLHPNRAVLCDINAELMLCYEVVRDQVEALIKALGQHQNTSEHYHKVRAQVPSMLPPIERAARLIFLNKTCYNGLYRVNRDGHFNVPYGRNGRSIFRDVAVLRRVSTQLQGVQLRCADYAAACQEAARGDLVYFDPPYLARSQRLIRYNQQGFPEAEHRRLAALVRELDRRGCFVMVSNSNVPLAHELYSDYRTEVIRLRRSVNANAEGRLGWDELLIRNFEVPADRATGPERPQPLDRQLSLLLR